jgi:N-carbamoyl-L-amino-acid hydrolase
VVASTATAAAVAHVDGQRLLRRLAELAAIGADPAGGVTRLAYTPEDVTARDLVADWLRTTGATVTVDAAGNLVGVVDGREDRLGALATGSHLDTVVRAGPLDGAYGVVAAVEVAQALVDGGLRLRHPLRIIAFSNEEGSRGTPGMVGSCALAGRPLDLEALDDDGVSLAERLRDVRGVPERLADCAWRPREVAGFIELHIEQGPVLERGGHRVGVVTAITGRVGVELVIRGEPRHAGTTPMTARRDALVAAAHLVLAVERLARAGAVRVATTGRLEARPGVRNVVPGAAVVSAELRDDAARRLSTAVEELRRQARRAATLTGCTVEVSVGQVVEPVATDPVLRGCVAEAARALDLSASELPSGAGHDAQVVADVAPVAMAFVPSRAGVSHAPEEATDDADLIAGARLLLTALLLADARLDPELDPELDAELDPVGGPA